MTAQPKREHGTSLTSVEVGYIPNFSEYCQEDEPNPRSDALLECLPLFVCENSSIPTALVTFDQSPPFELFFSVIIP